MTPVIPGSRWLSTAEPELGLGTILRIQGRQLTVLFSAAQVTRLYAAHAAPLSRAAFVPGDRIKARGQTLRVEAVIERDGLYHYHCGDAEIAESELDDIQGSGQASERLRSARVDPPGMFDLRLEALGRRAALRVSAGSGALGARIELIPHQLTVASVLAARRHPRALLADEVGLGKTIEACLTIARLIASGRAQRVLVLVPEPLVYQWFVELKRRFNLNFAIFDEERIEAIALADDGRNPFEDEQLVLTDWQFLVNAPQHARSALKAGWDLLVVDEAHHLAWSPSEESPEYVLVEAFARRVPAVLLLTATPEQLGQSGHFARLRLLDPNRFHDPDLFAADSERFVALSGLIAALSEQRQPSADERAALTAFVTSDEHDLLALLDTAEPDAAQAGRRALLSRLIDRHGTGRVMFRNRRAKVGGFPARVPKLQLIEQVADEAPLRDSLREEFHADRNPAAAEPPYDYGRDPRLAALIDLLQTDPQAKVLLICRSAAKVHAIDEALTLRAGLTVAKFHEGLGIVQRDRAAAHFADPAGARILLASEIGSEGRNFQFAQHLFLWDLPFDPDQLEQRIGRLDRIGQRGDVQIHAVVVTGSAQHAMLRWYAEGLNAFASSPEDARAIVKHFGPRLAQLAERYARGDELAHSELEVLLEETRALHAQLSDQIASGRDRLLELTAEFDPAAETMLDALLAADADAGVESFMLQLLEHFGVEVHELDPSTVLLDPEMIRGDGLPELDQARRATFRRSLALAREDLAFLRLDHPLIEGAIDRLLGGDAGNAAIALDDSLPPRTALLQVVYVLECVAPPALAIDRFLAPQPLLVCIDSKLVAREDLSPDSAAMQRYAERGFDVARLKPLLQKLLPPMLAGAEALAGESAAALIAQAETSARQTLDAELTRLEALARVNPSVRADEIDAVRNERAAVLERLPQASLRLDAVRFIASIDVLNLRR